MRKNGLVIAIDGPAGVGKSTVGKAIAAQFGYGFINTGEMYRALAWKLLRDGIDISDEASVERVLRASKWDFVKGEGVALRTLIDGTDPGAALRSEAASKTSSAIAKQAAVRSLMKDMQRRLGSDGGIVMEGRDIGTAVFPDAELKIYLDASPQERAKRRVLQLEQEGYEADYDAILAGIIARDGNDSGRKLAPLKKAADSVVVDTSTLTLEQVTAELLTLVKQRCTRI